MNQTLTLNLIYCLYLLVPGYIVVLSLSINKNRFLLSYAISFTLLILSQLPFQYFGTSVTTWLLALHLFYLFVPLVILLFKNNRKYRHKPLHCKKLSASSILGFVVILIFFSIYHLIVGAYTEIPSDYWEHLARVNSAKLQVADNIFNVKPESFQEIFFQSDIIHFLHALTAH